jgi:molybdate transport system regulatory protein
MAGDSLADIFGSVGDLKQDDGVRAKTKTAKRPVRALGAKERARATPRLRIVMGKGLMLGPGKIDLLEAIARKGSISAAAREMDMSYRRAWLLVDALNHMFPSVLVTAAPGGSRGGGAKLTDYGRGVAAAYRRVEARARAAMREEMAAFDVRVDKD